MINFNFDDELNKTAEFLTSNHHTRSKSFDHIDLNVDYG